MFDRRTFDSTAWQIIPKLGEWTRGAQRKHWVTGLVSMISNMQTKREQTQQQMMLLPPLESFIPEDHPLRRLNNPLSTHHKWWGTGQPPQDK